MNNYHPDHIYHFVQEKLQEKRAASPQPVVAQGRFGTMKDRILYDSGSMLVQIGKRLQCAVGPEYCSPQVAIEA